MTSSIGIVAHSIFGGSVWFAGPVALNGAAGGSEHYYKRTEDVTDWSGAPIALPLGKTALQRIMTAHRGVWMTFTSGNSVVSFDAGDTWDECDVDLQEEDVYFNGRVYVCGSRLSTDGIAWTTMPNMPADMRAYTAARQQDNLIVCAYNTGTISYFEYTFDEGATWTNVPVAGVFFEEPFYSLTLSNRTRRVHWSLGNVAPSVGITGLYSDDLFVNQYRDGGQTVGRYPALYGCSHLMQSTGTNEMALSKDAGWSWSDLSGGINHTGGGSPGTYTIRYSTDGGDTFNTGDTIYGTVTNLAYVGTDGNCALYPVPTYAATTEQELWQGTPDAIETISEHNYGSNNPHFSPDGQYLLDLDSSNSIQVYKKSPSGRGYDLLVGAIPANGNEVWTISEDNQYFVVGLEGGAGWKAYRQEDDVFTELTVSNPATRHGLYQFHPSTNTLVAGHATSAVVQIYTFSGTTVNGPYNSASTGHTPYKLDVARDNMWAIIATTFDDLRMIDFSNPTVSVPILASSVLPATQGGNRGVFFSGDESSVITVSYVTSNTYINTHPWDGNATIGSPVLLTTAVATTSHSALTQDGLYLLTVKSSGTPHAVVYVLDETGTTLVDSYAPTTQLNTTQAIYCQWIGV
jgi:hypothetical protein